MRNPNILDRLFDSFSARLDDAIRKNAKVYGDNYYVESFSEDRALFLSFKTGALYEYTEPEATITRVDFSQEGLKQKTRLVCERLAGAAVTGEGLDVALDEYSSLISERVLLMKMPMQGVFPLAESDRKKVFNSLMENELFVEYLTELGKAMKNGRMLLVESLPFIGLRSREKLIKFFRDQIGLTYEQSKLLTHNLLNIGLGQQFKLERFDFKNLHRATAAYLGEPKARELSHLMMETVARHLLGEIQISTPAKPEDIKNQFMTSQDVKPGNAVKFTPDEIQNGTVSVVGDVGGSPKPLNPDTEYEVEKVDDATGTVHFKGGISTQIKKAPQGTAPGTSVPTGSPTKIAMESRLLEAEEDAEDEKELAELEEDEDAKEKTEEVNDVDWTLSQVKDSLEDLLSHADGMDEEQKEALEKDLEYLEGVDEEVAEEAPEDYSEAETAEGEEDEEPEDDENEETVEVEEFEDAEVDGFGAPAPPEEDPDEGFESEEDLLVPGSEEEKVEDEEIEDHAHEEFPGSFDREESSILVGNEYMFEEDDQVSDVETGMLLFPGSYTIMDIDDEKSAAVMMDDDGNKFFVDLSVLSSFEEDYSPIKEDVRSGDALELLSEDEGGDEVTCVGGKKVLPPGYYFVDDTGEDTVTVTKVDESGDGSEEQYIISLQSLESFVRVDVDGQEPEAADGDDRVEFDDEPEVSTESKHLMEKREPPPTPFESNSQKDTGSLPKTPFESGDMDASVPSGPGFGDDFALDPPADSPITPASKTSGSPAISDDEVPDPSESDLLDELTPLDLGGVDEDGNDLEVPEAGEEGVSLDGEDAPDFEGDGGEEGGMDGLGDAGGGGGGGGEGEEGSEGAASGAAAIGDSLSGSIEPTEALAPDFETVAPEDLGTAIFGEPDQPGDVPGMTPEGEPGLEDLSDVEHVVGEEDPDFATGTALSSGRGFQDLNPEMSSDPEAMFLFNKLNQVSETMTQLDTQEGVDGVKASDTYQTSTEVKEYKELLNALTNKLKDSPDEFTKQQVKKFLEFFVPEDELKSFYDITSPEMATETEPELKGEALPNLGTLPEGMS
jgi:hypothetical protein